MFLNAPKDAAAKFGKQFAGDIFQACALQVGSLDKAFASWRFSHQSPSVRFLKLVIHLLHGFEQSLSIVVEGHDQLELGAS